MKPVIRKFDGRAEDYTAGRPDYAAALIDCMYREYGVSDASVIADIGSGTGKFARHLLDRGSEVYCVEPNDDMRRTAERELRSYEKFHSVTGTAEHTTLADGAADFVTAAQAFHWFDGKRFKEECLRILKDGGTVFLIWNARDGSDLLNQELFRLHTAYCPGFKGFSGGTKQDDPKIRSFFDGQYVSMSFDHPLTFDRDRFVARCLSSSYSLRKGDKDYDDYIDALNELFDRHEHHGLVSVANQSVAYVGAIGQGR